MKNLFGRVSEGTYRTEDTVTVRSYLAASLPTVSLQFYGANDICPETLPPSE